MKLTLNAISVNENSIDAVNSWLASMYDMLAWANSHSGWDDAVVDQILPGIPVGVFLNKLSVPTFYKTFYNKKKTQPIGRFITKQQNNLFLVFFRIIGS